MSYKKITLLILIILYPVFICFAQQAFSTRADIQLNVQSDSLERNTTSQEIIFSITSNSPDAIGSVALNIDQTAVAWTVRSAELNGQPIWLIKSDSKANRENVLAWQYQKEDHTLYLYPENWPATYDLTITVCMNLLYPRRIERQSRRDIRMLVNVDGAWYQTEAESNTTGVAFK